MATPHLADALRNQVRASLEAAADAREAELIRDLALVLAGARPAAYVWEAGPAIAPLVAAVEAAGFPVTRWDDLAYGQYAAVARKREVADTVAELAQREMEGPLSRQDEADLGQALGYPTASVLAYVRAQGGYKDAMLSERDWTPDERRFLLCLHGATPEEATVGRAYADMLLTAFRDNYGVDALARLPVGAPHGHKQR